MSGWIKPQTCDTSACVELKVEEHFVRVRTTGSRAEILVYREELAEFIKSVKQGQYDGIAGL